ncbi:DUF560 domain-containing protein [Salmonella enterica]|nr:DUF560 domain-containing protein [Salmonella enterica]
MLYLNKDIHSAEEQLRKLRSENLSEEAAGLIDGFIARVQKADHWSFRGGLTYLNEKNINNVPPSSRTIGGWKSEKPQSGKGMMYWGEAEKRFSLPDNFFVITQLAAAGKIYWNNHPYDELDGSIGAGMGYRNVNTMVQLSHFTKKVIMAEDRRQMVVCSLTQILLVLKWKQNSSSHHAGVCTRI